MDAHLIRQRPAGDVVGRLGRATRTRADVGVALRLEQVLRERPERLVEPHDPAAGVIDLPVRRERRVGAVDLDAAAHQGLDEQRGRRQVVLLRRDDVGNRRLRLPLLNLPRADLVDAVEERLAVLRRDVEHRERSGQHVIDASFRCNVPPFHGLG